MANYSLHINAIGLTNYVSEQKPPITNILYDSMSVNKSMSWHGTTSGFSSLYGWTLVSHFALAEKDTWYIQVTFILSFHQFILFYWFVRSFAVNWKSNT